MIYAIPYLLLAITVAAVSYASLARSDAQNPQSQLVCGILGLLWPPMVVLLTLSLLASFVALTGVAIVDRLDGLSRRDPRQ